MCIHYLVRKGSAAFPPKVMLFNEPISALDPEMVGEAPAFFSNPREPRTIEFLSRVLWKRFAQILSCFVTKRRGFP